MKAIGDLIGSLVTAFMFMGTASFFSWLRDEPLPTWGLFLAAALGVNLYRRLCVESAVEKMTGVKL